MGMYNEKDGMGLIYKSCRKHFIKNIDFILYEKFEDFKNNYIDKVPDLSPELNISYENILNAKYLIIKPESFKKWMMRIRTDKGDEVCDYFLKLENLFQDYLLYQTISKDEQYKEQQKMIELKDNQLHAKQNEINLLHHKNIKLKKEQFNGKHIEYSTNTKQKIYVITTKQSTLKFNNKVGGTAKNINTRMVSLNTSFPKGEELELIKEYDVYNYKIIEHLVHKILNQFCSKEHIIGIPWHYLQSIIEKAIECEKIMIEQYNRTIDNILIDIDNNNFNEDLPLTKSFGKKNANH